MRADPLGGWVRSKKKGMAGEVVISLENSDDMQLARCDHGVGFEASLLCGEAPLQPEGWRWSMTNVEEGQMNEKTAQLGDDQSYRVRDFLSRDGVRE